VVSVFVKLYNKTGLSHQSKLQLSSLVIWNRKKNEKCGNDQLRCGDWGEERGSDLLAIPLND
jgi:hypothetical protein